MALPARVPQGIGSCARFRGKSASYGALEPPKCLHLFGILASYYTSREIGVTLSNSQNLMDLTSDWWRSIAACEGMVRWFRRHLLGLWIRAEVQGVEESVFFTGFLLDYQGVLLWITAGHIIDRIVEIRSNPDIEMSNIRWVDQCDTPGAESIPITEAVCYSATRIGIDFGAIRIQSLEAENIRACDRNTPMREITWMGLERARPEGYYIVGCPREGFETAEGILSNGRRWGVAEAKFACLPVERIEYKDRCQLRGSAQWWNKPDSFFGQIRPFTDAAIKQPEDIDWMSGSPVFSIEREPEGVRYRLVGVQSSWVKSARQIRAEPIHTIVPLIDNFLMQ
jgi:hypothetical protein